MPSPSRPPRIAVLGAAGVVGRRICAELARRGAAVAIAGRRSLALAEVSDSVPVASMHTADADDPGALARAFAGARVVVNAAGPLRDTASQVLEAALAAGAHYVDVGGEQAVLRALYERHESEVRRAGLVALPGAGLDCAIGDLASAWAAGHLVGTRDAGDTVRDAPAPWLAEQHPVDDIAVTYVLDDAALSPGSQRALFGALGTRALVWRRDRWEPWRSGLHRIDAIPGLGELGELGARDAINYAGGDPITVPRHIGARLVASYVSVTRRPLATAALRLALGALRLVPRGAQQLLAPTPASDAAYGATRFAVIVEVRRGASAARIIAHGRDVYRTTAAITAWTACQLAERGAGPLGMRAPAELFRAEPALAEIAIAADLTIESSFA